MSEQAGEESQELSPGKQQGVLLSVSYNGGSFHGWAPQHGVPTIAGKLLDAVTQVDPTVREVRGASRTDTGVHAHAQAVCFDAQLTIPRPRMGACGEQATAAGNRNPERPHGARWAASSISDGSKALRIHVAVRPCA